MLAKTLPKIDRFIVVFGVILVPHALFVFFVVQTIFTSIAAAQTVDEELLKRTTPRLDSASLDKAHGQIFQPDYPLLDLRP